VVAGAEFARFARGGGGDMGCWMAESCTGPAEASRGLALVCVGMGSRLHAGSLENKFANPGTSVSLRFLFSARPRWSGEMELPALPGSSVNSLLAQYVLWMLCVKLTVPL